MDKDIKHILIFIILMGFIWYVYFSPITFNAYFMIEETEERLSGDIYVDEEYYGTAEKGKFSIPEASFSYLSGKELMYVLEYKNTTQEYFFDFPLDLYESDIEYIIPLNDLEEFVEEDRRIRLETQQAIENDAFSNTQFEHWNHNDLTYSYSSSCETLYGGRYIGNFEEGLYYISQNLDSNLTFREIDDEAEADIFINCFKVNDAQELASENTLGDTQSFVYPNTTIYSRAEIRMFTTMNCWDNGKPVVFIHELLHAIGLSHPMLNGVEALDGDTKNIMYNYVRPDCNSAIRQSDINYLKDIYG